MASADNPLIAFVNWFTSGISSRISSLASQLDFLKKVPIIGPFMKFVGWVGGLFILLFKISERSISLLMSPQDAVDFLIGVAFLPLTVYTMAAMFQLIITVIKSLPVVGAGGET